MSTGIRFSVLPSPTLSDIFPNATEEQGYSSLLGLTSSFLFEKHFEGDLVENGDNESNILAEGPEWVAKNLLSLRKDDHSLYEEPTLLI